MPTLQQKIEENAARKLAVPEGSAPNEAVHQYKEFLKLENHRLKNLHRAGGGGFEICRARSTVFDVLIRSALETVEAKLKPQFPKCSPWALIAIGGYGRRELNPGSDIDILFLHDGDMVQGNRPSPYMEALTDGLLYTLWDCGLKVGHAVRTIDECLQLAREDMETKTALFEARRIKGHKVLFENLQKAVYAKCIKGKEDDYIAARISDQEARRAKFGNSHSLQEPNIKNCSGGLRDYQNLLWMAYAKYQTRSLKELIAKDLISKEERRLLRKAYDFLLRTRTEMHYQQDRPNDILTRNIQAQVAENIGFEDPNSTLRLEQFMGKVYLHLRSVYLITKTLEQRLALIPQPKRFIPFREILRAHREKSGQKLLDGFIVQDGQIVQESAAVFQKEPERLMRIFLHVQKLGLRLHPELEQHIRAHLFMVDSHFKKNPHVNETFMEILDQAGNVAPILRIMHEVGFLGKYLPDFGKLTCLVQHEFYHQYTTDEHTLRCIEQLDNVRNLDENPYRGYQEILEDIQRPGILYLALILHDTGKRMRSGKHEVIGGVIAEKVGRRLQLPDFQINRLSTIIRLHLFMVQVSQRRDLDDPEVIQEFAKRVGSEERLRLLTLHTFADSMGTSSTLWTGFKNTLMLTLYNRALHSIRGDTEFERSEDAVRKALLKQVRKIIPKTLASDEIDAHFEKLPIRYFTTHDAKEIASDLQRAHQFMQFLICEESDALLPVVDWTHDRDRGVSVVNVCTWDRPALFSTIAGALAVAHLDISAARIFTRTDGIVFDSFSVIDTRTGELASKDSMEIFEQKLIEALDSESRNIEDIIIEIRDLPSTYSAINNEVIKTDVHFEQDPSGERTIIDVTSEDRPGILYAVSSALRDHKLSILLAKITSGRGAAIDTFYVTAADGTPITDEKTQKKIRKAIESAINAHRKIKKKKKTAG